MTNQEYVVFDSTMIVLRFYCYTIIKSESNANARMLIQSVID